MEKPVIVINGVEHPLATNLMVAYKVQGMNEHKAYSKVFSELAEMPIEKQIGVVYASLISATPDLAKTYPEVDFRNYCLNNMDLQELLELLSKIIDGIMGTKKEDSESTSEDEAKN